MRRNLALASAQHRAYLEKMGCLPEQLKATRPARRKLKNLGFSGSSKTYFEEKRITEVIQGDQSTGCARGMMANLHHESPEVQRQILEKASRSAPLYNKGGYQLINKSDDPKNIGRK